MLLLTSIPATVKIGRAVVEHTCALVTQAALSGEGEVRQLPATQSVLIDADGRDRAALSHLAAERCVAWIGSRAVLRRAPSAGLDRVYRSRGRDGRLRWRCTIDDVGGGTQVLSCCAQRSRRRATYVLSSTLLKDELTRSRRHSSVVNLDPGVDPAPLRTGDDSDSPAVARHGVGASAQPRFELFDRVQGGHSHSQRGATQGARGEHQGSRWQGVQAGGGAQGGAQN